MLHAKSYEIMLKRNAIITKIIQIYYILRTNPVPILVARNDRQD